MLRNLNTLFGYSIRALDGDIGTIESFFFDDATWIVRYAIVETGDWLQRRRVLLAASLLDVPDELSQEIPMGQLTREYVRHSPDIDLAQPVSRQQQVELHTYYDWPQYWIDSEEQESKGLLSSVPEIAEDNPPASKEEDIGDPHLRNLREIERYMVQGLDGEIGEVESLTADTESWIIQQLVVNGDDIKPGKKILIPTSLVQQIEWAESRIFVDILRDTIKENPEFDTASPITHDHENFLEEHAETRGV